MLEAIQDRARVRAAPRPPSRMLGVFLWLLFGCFLFLRFVALDDWFKQERQVRNQGFPGVFDNHHRNHRRTPIAERVGEIPPDLWRIEIDISSQNADILRGYYWNRGNEEDRPKVLVTVREGGVTYTNVTMHLKGSAGSFRPFDDKPAMTLNFSKEAKGQSFHGFTKISLNNSVQDPSYLEEAISREMFEAAGIPVARSTHATVALDGRDLGMYVVLEGLGKPFLRRYFKDVSGNLYEGAFCQEVHTRLDVDSGDDKDDRSDLERLLNATRHLAAAQRKPDIAPEALASRWRDLTNILDLEEFVTYAAMEVLTCHGDGYMINRNNYRLFHNRETGRIQFFPHGMDQMFGRFRSGPGMSVHPSDLQIQGQIARVVLDSDEGRKLYMERISFLATNMFVQERWLRRVDELSEKIRPTIAAYGSRATADFDRNATGLRNRIVQRSQSVKRALGRLEPLAFDAEGVLKLTDWAGQEIQGRGTFRFDQRQEEGKTLLYLTAVRGGGEGSWRSTITLEPGNYVFRGRARASGTDGSGAVRLRVSRGEADWEHAEDGEWVSLERPIRVSRRGEVWLVCEFQTEHGEACFDESSLELVRK